MNISYNWLKDIIDLGLTAEETAAALTRVGLAVEGIHPHGDDLVFDIDLTSNRPDCLSHFGVARELGVITGANTQPSLSGEAPGIDAVPFPAVLAPEIIKIEAPDLCHRFTARIIRNVTIGPSPEWLVNRLEAIGERSINNIADITNYVMHELGQPMHAFDLDKLAGSRIVVRRAAAGETITTLDEVARKLDDSMLAICDAEKPAAVAGVMGGIISGITDGTTNVLLEVAYFDRDNIRQTSRKLGLATEASYRFERGVDIENLIRASDRATELIVELAGGEAADLIDIYPSRYRTQTVDSADLSNAVTRLSGLDVPQADCERILTALGITPNGHGTYAAPSWRHDIAIEEDLVEEVVRHSGYENIGNQLPPAYGAGELAPHEDRKRQIRRTLIDLGFIEAIGYSFIDTRHDDRFELIPEIAGHELVELRDSVIEGAVRMRPTIIPGLLDALKTNFNQQRRDLKLFEIGKVFAASSANELPIERELFAFAVTGGETFGERSLTGREFDFYDAKGSLEAALHAAGVNELVFEASEAKHLRPGQSAAISIDGTAVGLLGRLNEEISSNYKFKQPIYVGEIDLQAVLSTPAEQIVYEPLPKFPSIVRDVSFTIGRSIRYADLEKEIIASAPTHFRRVQFVDLYRGKGLAENESSLTLRLEYRSDDRTLTDSDVDERHAALVRSLEERFAITQR